MTDNASEMPRPTSVLVVIPALNEEGSVGLVVKEVLAALPDAHLLVVDDGSVDRTRQVALDAGADVLSLPFNLGVGGALRAGFRYAVRFDYDIAVQVDGDGQHDPAEVGRLLDALNDADMVIGARFAGRGDYAVRGARRLAMRLLARSMSRRTKVDLTDTTSGFRAFNRRAIDIFARDYPAEYLGDTVEALLIAARAGCRVSQVPVQMRRRLVGESRQSSIRSFGYLVRAVLAVLMSRARRKGVS
jgi:glycosyltransferase involved in cell wall biosynthesis